MASRNFLLCLILYCLFSTVIECKRFGGGSSRSSSSSWGKSSSSSGSSWGKGWGSSSSSSSGSSWGKGWGSSSSGSSGSHSYPSSSSGLSGYGSHSYPSSSSGLSGSGSGSGFKLPSIGWSGSSSGSHSYPSSSSGLSGSGKTSGSHSYPSSSSGLSGSGSGSGYHSYPSSSSGMSGYGSGTGSNNRYNPSHDSSYHATNTYHTNSGYNSGHGWRYNPPTYYSTPQHIYVTQYRNSDSSYSDLLTGLALYNMGRSHNHYHDHYYYDDYYRTRYPDSSHSNYKTEGDAVCTLRIVKNGDLQVLKIPCEIVSTFTEGSDKLKQNDLPVNKILCTSNVTVVNNTQTTNTSDATLTNSTQAVNGSLVNSTVSSNTTTVNTTTCINATDPMNVKGSAINVSDMQCTVEIRTNNLAMKQNIDCGLLMQYSKMPEPKKEGGSLPSRSKLKSWLENPPWWLSVFVAV